MGWQAGKSFYERVVERALIQLSASSVLCSDYRYNHSTWFSGRLRYDFVLGASIPPICISPYLIEVHGEQPLSLDSQQRERHHKKTSSPRTRVPLPCDSVPASLFRFR